MIDVSELVKKYRFRIAKTYFGKELSALTEHELNLCTSWAEVKGYTKGVVPSKYLKYTIFDFDGKVEGSDNPMLSTDIVLAARNKVSKYCWGVTAEKLSEIREHDDCQKRLDLSSKLYHRRRKGNNVVIAGVEGRSVGRSMIAALILKEAIKTRLVSGHESEKYGWLDFSRLLELSESFDPDFYYYRNCDWLVVDDITPLYVSNHPDYRAKENRSRSRMKEFFADRDLKGMPTIFTFRFNVVDKFYDVEQMYGPSVSRIIHKTSGEDRTCTIRLCGENDSGDK